jgi:hypothetical protein
MGGIMVTLVVMRIVASPLMNMFSNLFILGLLAYFLCKFLIRPVFGTSKDQSEKKTEQAKILKLYAHESYLISRQITDWLRVNIKDGNPISKLYDPELMALFEKSQELHNKIIELDPSYNATPPLQFHNHIVELARGQYKQTH